MVITGLMGMAFMSFSGIKLDKGEDQSDDATKETTELVEKTDKVVSND